MKAITTLLALVVAAPFALASTLQQGGGHTTAPTEARVERVFTSCRIVPGVSAQGRPEGWGVDILNKQIMDALAPSMDADEFIGQVLPTLSLYAAAKSGTLSVDFEYHPHAGFHGVDTAILSFRFKGKTYLSLYKFVVITPKDEKPLPYDCKDAWKLGAFAERPNRSFDTDAQRRVFASLRPSPPVAGQLRR